MTSVVSWMVVAFRLYRRRPTFALITTVAIALGVAVNITVFAIVDAARSPSRPVAESQQLIALRYFEPLYSAAGQLAFAEALESTPPSLRGLTSYSWDGKAIASTAKTWRDVYTAVVAEDFFGVLQPRPQAGRLLGPGDREGGRRIVVTNVVERALFPPGVSAVGRTIDLGGQTATVVGVLPRLAGYPEWADVWRLGLPSGTNGSFFLARRRDGASTDRVRSELDLLRRRVAASRGLRVGDTRVEIQDAFPTARRLQALHWLLIIAAATALLIACFNVANLQLARGFERAQELAVRSALGASRRQLLSQLLAEIVALAVVGSVAGLLLATWGVGIFASTVPIIDARGLVQPQWSWRVAVETLGVLLIVLLCFGGISALVLSRVQAAEALRSGSNTRISRLERLVGAGLLAGQIGLSLSLCIHSTLITRTALRLQQYSSGFETSHLVTGAITTAPITVGAAATRRPQLADGLVTGLTSLPNVVNASATIWSAPPTDEIVTTDDVGGRLREAPAPRWFYLVVTPAYFRTLGVRMRHGRDFNAFGEGTPVAIINEEAARRWWPGTDPLGRMIKLGSMRAEAAWVQVVGIVPDIQLTPSFEAENTPLVVICHTADTTSVPVGTRATFAFIARTQGNVDSLAVLIRRFANPAGSIGNRTWATGWDRAKGIDELRSRHSFIATVFWTITGLALSLALTGVYSLTTYAASRRSTEYGVRAALGAPPARLVLESIRETNVITMAGVAFGLLVAAWSAALLRALLLGLEPFEPLVFAAVAAAMLVVVTLAALPSALRTSATDPANTLRSV